MLRGDREGHPDGKAQCTDCARRGREPLVAASHRSRDEGERKRERDHAPRAVGEADQADREGGGGEQSRDGLRRTLPRACRPR